MPKSKVTVKQIEGVEIPVEVIALSILDIAEASKKILAAGLTQEALIVLIKHKTSCHSYQIKAVLEALPELANIYCTKLKKK